MNKKPIAFNGVEYTSFSELARAHGVLPRNLFNRLSAGHTIQSAIDLRPGLTRRVIKNRAEWMAELNYSVDGLCTSAIWEKWGEMLAELSKNFSASVIAAMFGVTYPVIVSDQKRFGIPVRPKGWTPYKGKKHYEVKDETNLRRMQVERSKRLSQQRRDSLCGLGV
jgi:hypothetical protein